MLLKEESVLSFKEKQHNLGLPTFKLRASTKTLFKTNPLNIIFDEFSI